MSDPVIDSATGGDWRGTYGSCFQLIPDTDTRLVEEPVGPGSAIANPGQYSHTCYSGPLLDQGKIDFRIFQAPGNTPAFAWTYLEADGTIDGNHIAPGASQWNECRADFRNATFDNHRFVNDPMSAEILLTTGGDATVAFYFVNGHTECRELQWTLSIDGLVEKTGTIGDFSQGKYLVFDLQNIPAAGALIRLDTNDAPGTPDCGLPNQVNGLNSIVSGIFIDGTNACPAPLARLGDRVWEDEDVDGTQDCQDTNMNGIVGDAGDTGPECGNGIPNLPVEAFDPGGDMICDTADDVPLGMMTMTDAEGFYSFDNLAPGTYCVQFSLPADDFCIVDGVSLGSPQFTASNIGNDMFDSDANPLTGRTGNIPLMAGDNDLTNDAGVYCPAKLGDRVWEDDGNGVQDCMDTNGNGIIGDAGDVGPECGSGVDNVQVELFECGPDGMAGTMDDVATGEIRMTDIMGFYMFGGEPGVYDLPPGTYYTKVTKPDGTDFTVPGVGNDAFDSDCGPDGMTQCIALGSGDIDRTTDCGIVTPPPQCDLMLGKTCLVSEPPPSDFVCSKPIDELSMIWNGPENNVSIIAYKGDTSATVLANIGGIMIGDTVTVSGFAGSPNDVFWEVFNEFGVKIGDSVFHLSCSDDDMNGPEDCGKPAGDGKQKKTKKGSKKGDTTTDLINQWLFEGMVDSDETLSCSAPPGGGGGPFPTADACSFMGTSADVTYGYTVTNLGDPVTGIMVTDDLLGAIGGPVDLGTGDSAQFTAMTTLFDTTTNVATATGFLSDGSACPAMDSLTVEKVVPPGSCDDGKATELVFTYTGDPCSATTNFQLDSKGNAKFSCDPSPGTPLAGLSSVVLTKDADKLSVDIVGDTVRIFRSDVIGEKLNADTQYTITDVNGDQQSQNLHTSCSKPLAVGDQFGALVLIQLINEF